MAIPHGTMTGRVLVAVGDSEPIEIGTIEIDLPLCLQPTRTDPPSHER